MVEPSTLFIFHLQAAMEMMTKRSMRKSSTMAQKSPLLVTATGAKPWEAEYRSHGTGRLWNEKRQREKETNKSINCVIICIFLTTAQAHQATGAHPIVTSKMLLPKELDTAMSPRPLRATITLVMRSGMEVPAARMVRPIISSEIPMVSPT